MRHTNSAKDKSLWQHRRRRVGVSGIQSLFLDKNSFFDHCSACQEIMMRMHHKWARWLHNPCRLGCAERFKEGDKINNCSQLGRMAT